MAFEMSRWLFDLIFVFTILVIIGLIKLYTSRNPDKKSSKKLDKFMDKLGKKEQVDTPKQLIGVGSGVMLLQLILNLSLEHYNTIYLYFLGGGLLASGISLYIKEKYYS